MKTNNKQENASVFTVADEATSPTMLVDYEKYAQYLIDIDLTEPEKRAYIEAIWGIMVDFVALGFDVHPLQQVGQKATHLSERRDASANGDEIKNSLPISLSRVVSSDQPKQEKHDPKSIKIAPVQVRCLEREES